MLHVQKYCTIMIQFTAPSENVHSLFIILLYFCVEKAQRHLAPTTLKARTRRCNYDFSTHKYEPHRRTITRAITAAHVVRCLVEQVEPILVHFWAFNCIDALYIKQRCG